MISWGLPWYRNRDAHKHKHTGDTVKHMFIEKNGLNTSPDKHEESSTIRSNATQAYTDKQPHTYTQIMDSHIHRDISVDEDTDRNINTDTYTQSQQHEQR